MKKHLGLLILLTAVLLLFFACDFFEERIPTAIRVKGSPELRFGVTMDFGKLFTDMLEEGFNDMAEMDIIPCVNTEAQTFLIYMELFNVAFTTSFDDDGNPIISMDGMDDILFGDWMDQVDPDGVHTLEEEKDIVEFEDPLVVPLSSLGDYLDGFKFKEPQTKLFFTGSADNEIFDKLVIEVLINGELSPPAQIGDVGNLSSGLKGLEEYVGTTSPAGGVEKDIPFDGNDVEVSFRLYFPEGTQLTSDDFTDGVIVIELVVWLPLILIPIDPQAGAQITFPAGIFDAGKDLFGRSGPNDDSMMADVIKSLYLEIGFNVNPFKGADLVVYNMYTCDKIECQEDGCVCVWEEFEIINKLAGDAFSFRITESDMAKINSPEQWPFTPNFKLRFGSNAEVVFPREFKTREFAFLVQIDYTMQL